MHAMNGLMKAESWKLNSRQVMGWILERFIRCCAVNTLHPLCFGFYLARCWTFVDGLVVWINILRVED